jgi:hypothetical protein
MAGATRKEYACRLHSRIPGLHSVDPAPEPSPRAAAKLSCMPCQHPTSTDSCCAAFPCPTPSPWPHQPELSRLLYPLLVATYLALVEAGDTGGAAALLDAHRRRMVEVGGRVAAGRAAELQELAALTAPGHVTSSAWVAAVRGSPCVLRLTTASFELLMHHLQAAKQWLMLALVNSAIRFQVRRGLPGAGGRRGRRAAQHITRSLLLVSASLCTLLRWPL